MHRAEISLSCNQLYYLETIGVMVMVFNATFNIISVVIKFVTVRWFSPDTSVYSTNKTDRHDITYS
jgi:hypothetical protein